MGTTLAEDLDFYARLYPAVETAYFWNGKSFCYLQTETNYAHNVKIDYYSQLEIHLDIKSWFQKSGLYLTYKDQLDSKIAQYAAYILFYDHEDPQASKAQQSGFLNSRCSESTPRRAIRSRTGNSNFKSRIWFDCTQSLHGTETKGDWNPRKPILSASQDRGIQRRRMFLI